MIFDDEDDGPAIERSPEHKLRHNLFGVLVCTGMAHLVMTTFEIPNISYIRVFLIGFIYAALSISVKLGHKNAFHHSAIAAITSMVSIGIEFMISGSHYVASSLIIFDLVVVYFYTQYLRLEKSNTLDSDMAPLANAELETDA